MMVYALCSMFGLQPVLPMVMVAHCSNASVKFARKLFRQLFCNNINNQNNANSLEITRISSYKFAYVGWRAHELDVKWVENSFGKFPHFRFLTATWMPLIMHIMMIQVLIYLVTVTFGAHSPASCILNAFIRN